MTMTAMGCDLMQAMQTGGRGPRFVRAALLAAAALAIASSSGAAFAGNIAQRFSADSRQLARGSLETVYFADRRQAPVQIVRGSAPPADRPIQRENVSFGDGAAQRVTIVRGTMDPAAAADTAPARRAALAPQKTVERVVFAGSVIESRGQPDVTVVRGGAASSDLFSADLFGPAKAGELDRIAHAVHGVESSYGSNPRMWRPQFAGPQGPMQVSAAAALDVGGGDRFDMLENRLLGRAYLARMYRRYGNWPDALAAYNWGPGNVDQWIARGRPAERLPLETIRYIEHVSRDAMIAAASGGRL